MMFLVSYFRFANTSRNRRSREETSRTFEVWEVEPQMLKVLNNTLDELLQAGDINPRMGRNFGRYCTYGGCKVQPESGPPCVLSFGVLGLGLRVYLRGTARCDWGGESSVMLQRTADISLSPEWAFVLSISPPLPIQPHVGMSDVRKISNWDSDDQNCNFGLNCGSEHTRHYIINEIKKCLQQRPSDGNTLEPIMVENLWLCFAIQK